MAAVLVANLINVAGSFVDDPAVVRIGTDLQSALLEEYLARPYVFHASTHSAILFNNVIHETSRATNEVLQNVFSAGDEYRHRDVHHSIGDAAQPRGRRRDDRCPRRGLYR